MVPRTLRGKTFRAFQTQKTRRRPIHTEIPPHRIAPNPTAKPFHTLLFFIFPHCNTLF
jgi:hypothetical protein